MNARVERQWREDCEELVVLAGQLRDKGPDLLRRAAILVADGFTAGQGYDETGRRSSPDGPPDPVAAIVSTAEWMAERGIDSDPVGTALAAMRRHLLTALRELRAADIERARAVYVPGRERPIEPPEAQGCVNCDRFDVWSIVHKAGRCSACYEYRRRHDGRDAPEHLVRDRPEVSGRRKMLSAGELGDVDEQHR